MHIKALISLCLGYFMVVMDATIINVALPDLESNLHTGISGLQWVIDGYTLSFACLMLFAGYLSDQLGAKRLFTVGVFFFVVFSIGCGLSSNTLLLIGFRVLQGAAASLIVPSSLSLVHMSFPNSQQRARAIGVLAAVAGIAAATGPVFGAVLVHFLGWRAIFFVNILFGFVCFMWGLHWIKCLKRHNQHQGFDFLGQAFAILMMTCFSLFLIEGGHIGWLMPGVIGCAVLTVAFFTAFILTEHHVRCPMLPLTFFKSPQFSIIIAVGGVMNLVFFGILFILPLYFERVTKLSILGTGCAVFPLVAMIAVSSYLSGRCVSRVGTRGPLFLGLWLATVGLTCLLVVMYFGAAYLWMIVPLSLIGFGVAFIMPAANVAIMHAVPHSRSGMAAALFNMSRQLGSLMGVALFGSIINSVGAFNLGVEFTILISIFLFSCSIFFMHFLVKE